MINNWQEANVLAHLKQRAVDKLELIGEFGEGVAKQICPVDTGNLRGSIHHEVNEDGMYVRIGTPVEYAAYVEFGTGEKAENGNGKPGFPGQKAQPFLRPILMDHKKEIQQLANL